MLFRSLFRDRLLPERVLEGIRDDPWFSPKMRQWAVRLMGTEKMQLDPDYVQERIGREEEKFKAGGEVDFDLVIAGKTWLIEKGPDDSKKIDNEWLGLHRQLALFHFLNGDFSQTVAQMETLIELLPANRVTGAEHHLEELRRLNTKVLETGITPLQAIMEAAQNEGALPKK